MGDISNVVTLLPVPQVQGAPAIGQGSTSQANSALAGIPAGTLLEGFIVNRDASGNPVVRTQNGDIPFASNFFLKIGSEVVIRVGNSGGTTLAHLLSVDGQPPEIAATISPFSNAPSVIVSPQLGQQGTGPAAATQVNVPTTPTGEPTITVTGTVISEPDAAHPQAQQLPAGTRVVLKVDSLNVPDTAPQAPAASATPAATPGTTPASSAFYATYAKASGAPAPSSATAAPPADAPHVQAPLQAYTPLPAQPVNAVAEPVATPATNAPATPPAPPQAATAQTVSTTTQPLPAQETAQQPPATAAQPLPASPTTPLTVPVVQSTTPQPGQHITATVIGSETTGEALVHTPIGVIRLQPGTKIPSGSTITFEIVELAGSLQTAASVQPAATQPAPFTVLAQQWGSLQQIFTLLAGRSTLTGLDEQLFVFSAPEDGQGQQRTPVLTAQNLTTGMLSFLTALKNNDITNWLGFSNVRQLKDQGHDDILKKIQGEFTEMSHQLTQSQTQPHQWQPLFIPVAVDGLLQQIRFFTRRERQKNKQTGAESEDTRFVIEVDLTQLGEVQMDGFVRKDGRDLQFDMVIRSLAVLPTEVQADILRIYNDTGAITGYKGSLSFQSVKEFPVNPMQDIVSGGGPVVA